MKEVQLIINVSYISAEMTHCLFLVMYSLCVHGQLHTRPHTHTHHLHPTHNYDFIHSPPTQCMLMYTLTHHTWLHAFVSHATHMNTHRRQLSLWKKGRLCTISSGFQEWVHWMQPHAGKSVRMPHIYDSIHLTHWNGHETLPNWAASKCVFATTGNSPFRHRHKRFRLCRMLLLQPEIMQDTI